MITEEVAHGAKHLYNEHLSERSVHVAIGECGSVPDDEEECGDERCEAQKGYDADVAKVQSFPAFQHVGMPEQHVRAEGDPCGDEDGD